MNIEIKWMQTMICPYDDDFFLPFANMFYVKMGIFLGKMSSLYLTLFSSGIYKCQKNMDPFSDHFQIEARIVHTQIPTVPRKRKFNEMQFIFALFRILDYVTIVMMMAMIIIIIIMELWFMHQKKPIQCITLDINKWILMIIWAVHLTPFDYNNLFFPFILLRCTIRRNSWRVYHFNRITQRYYTLFNGIGTVTKEIFFPIALY